MLSLLCILITAYIVVLFARAVLSWFPVEPGSSLGAIASVLVDVTEPVLAPARRIIPPVGMFDLSFIVVTFAFFLLRGIVCSAA